MAVSVGDIDLRLLLNSSGFNNSLKSIQQQANSVSAKMTGTLKKLGTAVAAAFSVAAIKNFSKECISAAAVQTEAETKLTTVMRQRMNASDKAVKSVESYASALQEAGVVGDEVQLAGAQQLATFLKTDEALKSLMPAMNNLAVQQNGVNVTSQSMVSIGNLMGKVMQGQTSALTRVGITFDEAQEKVLKYGNEQERAAMLAQVITDNVGEMNSAIASTPAGQLQKVKNSFGDIMETLGRALNNIFVPMLDFLNSIVSKLAEVANGFEELTKKIFGDSNSATAMGGLATDAGNATEAVEDTTEAVDDNTKATEKAKRSVAGFDKLNVLTKTETPTSYDKSSGGSSVSGSTSAVSNVVKDTGNGLSGAFNNLYEKSGFKDFVDNVQKGIDKVDWSAIGKNCKSVFNNAVPIAKTYLTKVEEVGKAAFGSVGSFVGGVVQVSGKQLQTMTGGVAKWLEEDKDKINSFITEIGGNFKIGFDNLSTFWDKGFNLMGESVDRVRPQMETAISDLLSGFTDFGGSVGTIVSDGFSIATNSLVEWIDNDGATIGEFFDNIQLQMADVMEFVGGVFSDIGEFLLGWWDGEGGSAIFQNVCDMFLNIGTTLMNVYNDWIMPAWNFIMGIFQSAWDNCLKPIFEQLWSVFGKVCDCIATIWNNFLSPLVNWIVDVLGPVFTNVFNAVGGVFDTVFSIIGDVVGGILKAFGGLIDFITGVFSGDWEKAWQGICDFFGGIWDGIWGIIKGVINLVIDGINLLWTGVYTVVSAIVNAVGGIASAIGSIFGQDWGWEMPSEPPLIPKLATGGLVKAPTLAVVGDNAGANTGNPEVIAPLSKLEGMLNTSSGEDTVILSEILLYLKKLYEMFVVFRNNGGNYYQFVAQINGNDIFNEIVRQNELYKNRHNGKSAFA